MNDFSKQQDSVSSVLKPAGFENGQGVISSAYLRDPADQSIHGTKEYQDYAALITRQISHTVKWYESVSRLLSNGLTTLEEVGPGDVLTNLFARIRKDPMPAEAFSPSLPSDAPAPAPAPPSASPAPGDPPRPPAAPSAPRWTASPRARMQPTSSKASSIPTPSSPKATPPPRSAPCRR